VGTVIVSKSEEGAGEVASSVLSRDLRAWLVEM